jgi:hypothetical protein
MHECVGMDVSIRVMNGAKWRGVLREVRGNGDVLIQPAQGDILWLRRHPKDSDHADATNQPQDEPLEAPSPAKRSQQP